MLHANRENAAVAKKVKSEIEGEASKPQAGICGEHSFS